MYKNKFLYTKKIKKFLTIYLVTALQETVKIVQILPKIEEKPENNFHFK